MDSIRHRLISQLVALHTLEKSRGYRISNAHSGTFCGAVKKSWGHQPFPLLSESSPSEATPVTVGKACRIKRHRQPGPFAPFEKL